jgi:hypothetical protein
MIYDLLVLPLRLRYTSSGQTRPRERFTVTFTCLGSFLPLWGFWRSILGGAMPVLGGSEVYLAFFK